MFRELTVTNSSMLIRDFGDPLCIGIFVTNKLTCSERTNSRKGFRGGSVSTHIHINRRKFDSFHRYLTPFRDITRM